MLYNNTQDTRQVFFQIWEKMQTNVVLEPMEQIIADIIQQHPEYQALLNNPEETLAKEFTPEMGETNPFLHMGMHIAIQEQIHNNQPIGIREIYQQNLIKYKDPHAVEHSMMDCLGEMIWQAQQNNSMPDFDFYIECIRSKG